MSAIEKNTFFDINKLPPEKGLLVFGLSMGKLQNRQNAQNCFEDIRHFSPSKVIKPLIGLNFIYSDFLYLYNDGSSAKIKDSFMDQVINHKNSMQNLIEKHPIEFQIQHAFNYMVWNQLYVGTKDFSDKLKEIHKLYEKDQIFQKYMKDDCDLFERELKENQIKFFLEEALMYYLLSHNEIKLPNDFIEGGQKWILNCYPGRPLKTTVYLSLLNPFKLDWKENPYQNSFYNLENKELINFDNVDLETYSVKPQ